jgi:hypothetical protein
MPACFVVVPSAQRAVLCTLTPQNHFCIVIISIVDGSTIHRSCTNTILVGFRSVPHPLYSAVPSTYLVYTIHLAPLRNLKRHSIHATSYRRTTWL